ncbi:ADP-ribosylglycohydrolase family protein [Cerasicoccus maritimus]|uniref:ADP-ribosylglycohydrolase family protein n=1 Tax=Cerasicoccus maritimus TaxID=490089 RepID=UPI002852AF5A|nr:ADP-ribosylglycohydrolase family protein [Cerasicoccus maritimus]
MTFSKVKEDVLAIPNYRDRVMGCWLGKAVGGTLGMPYEGHTGPLKLTYYDPVPETMLANDDLDLQVLWACLLDERGERPNVCPELFIKGWRDHINFPWDEYGVCKRNLENDILPPLTGAYDNWFANGMGAAIRSEIWACLAPGNPALAAAYAREDACLDHAGDGLWAEVWLASLQSAAFVESDINKVISIGLEYIPEGAQLRQAIQDTQLWWDQCHDWKKIRAKVLAKYGHENFTNVTENLAFIYLALLDGAGDFSRSICTAANCGKDTDCTAATVGALLGIMNPQCIDEKWLRPIGRNLVLSKEITGIQPPDTLGGFTDLILSLNKRLDGKWPKRATPHTIDRDLEIRAYVGSKDVDWFSHGWQTGKPYLLDLPPMTPVNFDGTFARFDISQVHENAIFVQYRFRLEQRMRTRVMFNSPHPCLVFLNNQFCFGREEGRMAPSPHRVPMHQSVDMHLDKGEHTLHAVLNKPDSTKFVEWVVGLSNCDDNDLWLSFPWIK